MCKLSLYGCVLVKIQLNYFFCCLFASTIIMLFYHYYYSIISLHLTYFLSLYNFSCCYQQHTTTTTTTTITTTTFTTTFGFYPRDAMLARSLRQRRVCPDIRLSVCHTPVLCLAERKQDREMYTV